MKASDKQIGGAHYKDMPIQPSEFSHKNKLTWCEANAIKYVCRHRFKNGLEDVRKAIHYLELLIEWEYIETWECLDCKATYPNTKLPCVCGSTDYVRVKGE